VSAALATLGRRLPIVMTGGNHDRWGASFWETEAGITYSPGEIRFRVGPLAVLAVHGDGVAEEHRSAVVMHRITRHPAAIWLYRAIHPDLGIWLVDRMSRHLADSTRDPAVLDRAQARQAAWASARLASDPTIDCLIVSHTHRQAVTEPAPGRWYLNPGAWVEGRQFAVVSSTGVELRRHQSGPAPAITGT
jgi:UDP-2,3-diacylglucosamine pyrophosphatase LpxH